MIKKHFYKFFYKKFTSKTVPFKINTFEGKYFKSIVSIFRFLQLWPYSDASQSSLHKFLFHAFYYASTLTLLIPQIASLIIDNLDIYDCISTSSMIIFHVITMCKYAAVLLNKKKIKALFDQILVDWKTVDNESERKLIIKYYDFGMLIRKIYFAIASTNWLCTFGVSYIPTIAETYFGFRNDTLLRVFKNKGHYFVDLGRNDDVIRSLHYAVISLFNTIIFISIAFFLITSVAHISGLFEILNYKLKLIGKKSKINGDSLKSWSSKYAIQDLREIIIFHAGILKNVDLLDKTLTYYLIITQIAFLGMIPTTLFAFYCSYRTHPFLSCHALLFSFVFLSELFFLNALGQHVLQQSEKICNAVYFSGWYELPVEYQRFLRIIMIRSMRSSKFSVGKFNILSYETFLTIVQTIFYYFTVFVSLI